MATRNSDLINRINKALVSVRPYLQRDGGDLEVIGVTRDKVVQIRLIGACDGCPFSFQTLKAGIEQAIRRELPEIKEVVAI